MIMNVHTRSFVWTRDPVMAPWVSISYPWYFNRILNFLFCVVFFAFLMFLLFKVFKRTRSNHTMEPEKKRVSGRVRVDPTRPEPDPKTRIFSGNPTWTWPENPNIFG